MNDKRCDKINATKDAIIDNLYEILHQNYFEAEYYDELTPVEADRKYAALQMYIEKVGEFVGSLWTSEPEELMNDLLKDNADVFERLKKENYE